MARSQNNLTPVRWTVEYKPPGGNWTVLVVDSATPERPQNYSPANQQNQDVSRSYFSPSGALGTWQMRVTFQPVAEQVWVPDFWWAPDGPGHYQTVLESETVTRLVGRKLYMSYEATISGKTTSRYKRPFYLKLPKPGPWDIKVVRNTPDSASAYLANETWWDSVKETVESRLSYPNSALVASVIDAQQFSNIPTRAYDVYGILCRVPTGYDPIARTYPETWDGTFQMKWTDNPAWIYYDLIVESRYGLGDLIDSAQVDKWALYAIAKYCDGQVPSGYGYLEPRFTCNTYIQTREDAYKILSSLSSVFRGMTYWGAGAVVSVADMPSDPVALFTNANVIDGDFTYSGSSRGVRHTVALVTWNNPDNMYRQEVEYVDDPEVVRRYGVVETEVVAFGCTSRGQAHRAGKWLLYTERLETEIVSFNTGLEGITVYPGAVIKVADKLRSGDRIGGRLLSVTADAVTLDSPVTLTSAAYTLTTLLPDGKLVDKIVTNAAGTHAVLNITPAFTTLPQVHAVWALASENLNPQTFRVISVTEENKTEISVTALAHDPNKYKMVEFDQAFQPLRTSAISTVAPEAPHNLTATDTLYVQGPGSIGTKLHASWEGVGVRYEVAWKQGSGNLQTLTALTNTVDIAPVQEGPLTLNVRAVDALGRGSPWASVDYTVLGKQAIPTTPVILNTEVTVAGIELTLAPSVDLDFKEFEIRVNGVNPVLVSSTKWIWPFTPTGDTVFAVYAVDTTEHRSEPATSTVTITAPEQPSIAAAFDGADVVLTITPPTSQLPLDRYNFRYGSSYAAGTDIGDSYATVQRIRATWSGARLFWVVAIDKAGNISSAASVSMNVISPPAPSMTAQVIDNNVLLYWSAGQGSLPIDTFELRKGAVWSSAEVIGTKSGGFTTVFETTGGTYTYQLAAIDTAGNIGTPSAINVTVSQPPDYVLRADIDAEVANTGSPTLYTRLARTLSSAILEDGAIKLPINTTETFAEHFTTRSWDSPQDQIDAGYPYYAQPNAASGYYEEEIDYGGTLASSKITVSPTGSTLYGTTSVSVTISTKLNSGDAWTDFTDASQVYATNFRYIKVRVTVTGTASMYALTALNIRLDSKVISDGGIMTCAASDSGGTSVTFNRAFTDITNIQATAHGTTAAYAIVDFTDTANPTEFKILLFNTSGSRVSGTASWSAEGYY